MAIPLSSTTLPFAPTSVISFPTPKRRPSAKFTSVEFNSGTKGVSETTMEDASERALAERWREIHGKDNWAGMLEPFDPMLRTELIRYGEMAQACYDAFDYNRYSINYGNCRFPKSEFFERLGMESHGYNVTRYLFATSSNSLPNFFKAWIEKWRRWSEKANWIGYVAVSDDETSLRLGRRDITIAWRGTVTQLEWLHDLMDILRPVSSYMIPSDPSVKVELGFVSLYTDKDEDCPGQCSEDPAAATVCPPQSLREQIMEEMKGLMNKYHDEELSITVTGHSLGAALAVLSAFDIAQIAETGSNRTKDGSSVPICVFSFSGPRVGNTAFKERFENTLGVKVLRVRNVHDVVPNAPGFLINEHVPLALRRLFEAFPWTYSHVGMELRLDHRNSPFLKDTIDKACAHNLEALLHLIDGYRGKGEPFSLACERDKALVNKACDFLKDEYLIPPTWRQDENKGMVRSKDGRWIQSSSMRGQLREKLRDELHHRFRKLGLADAE